MVVGVNGSRARVGWPFNVRRLRCLKQVRPHTPGAAQLSGKIGYIYPDFPPRGPVMDRYGKSNAALPMITTNAAIEAIPILSLLSAVVVLALVFMPCPRLINHLDFPYYFQAPKIIGQSRGRVKSKIGYFGRAAPQLSCPPPSAPAPSATTHAAPSIDGRSHRRLSSRRYPNWRWRWACVSGKWQSR